MIEKELEASKRVVSKDVKRIDELQRWFRFEYPERLNRFNRYSYLGLPLVETRYHLELEAYEKENELRMLKGEELLPELKFKDLF